VPLRRATVLGVALVVAAGCSTSKRAEETPVPTTVVNTTIATSTSLAVTTTIPAPTISTSTVARPQRTFESAWNPTVEGLLTFRGDPNRRFYGVGPVPAKPEVAWTYPKTGAMCRSSTAKGETKQWCGAGWTGQPTVHLRNGRTWLVFNAYDGAVHFVDAETGENILEPFVTGDIIKGTVTIDPDGFPIVYSGSRDNFFRALAIDRGGKAVELWRLSADAVSPTKWNNDWDGSALVLDDYLIEGGENSQLHVVKLNRGYDANGLVSVDPELVFNTPGWDDQLLRDLAGTSPSEVSIENSVAVDGDVVYFGNSGGLVQGWDLAPLRTGGAPTRVFRYWMGDDTDASIVIDEEGFLYVGAEYERQTARSREVGQLVKLDPKKPDDPLVWSFADSTRVPAGIWSTVAIDRGVVVTTTNGGRVVGLDQATGDVLWQFTLPAPLWQSPVIVDRVLIQGDCAGLLHGYDLDNPRAEPAELWSLTLGGCVEATPAVWKGSIFVATRGGRFFAARNLVPT
jgi:outer membrane protein assembly factor BamB